jgi:hypothetical protein
MLELLENRLAPATLVVTGFTPTSTGFSAQFSRLVDTGVLNIYDTQAGGLGASDVTLVGNTTGPVRGSLVVNGGGTGITFVRTGGVLAADTYNVTLRSAANGFRDTAGALLDGNADGIPGDDFVSSFTVTPSSAVVVSVPDFSRCPGQLVNVPATGTGLPLQLSNGAGVTAVTLSLLYNPNLLALTGVSVGSGLPAGATAGLNTSTPGIALLTFNSPTPLAPNGFWGPDD